jgi:hypothetical protein
MRFLTAIALSLAALPPPPGAMQGAEEPGDRVLLADRNELRGEIAGYEAGGRLVFKEREARSPIRLALEEVARLQFGKDEGIQPDPKAEQVRLFHGGLLSGQIRSFDGRSVSVEGPGGAFRVARGDVKALSFGPLQGPLPELKEERKDILIREVERKEEGKEKPVRENVAEYGLLKSIEGDVAFETAAERKEGAAAVRPREVRRYDRASVKQIYLYREEPAPELPPGWFSKVLLKNGDKLVGVVESFGPDRVRLFSHLFGSAEIPKSRIHSIAFVQHARMTVGNILICDQNGVRELDRQGRELWSYTNNTQYAWSARKLENGNVLIANTNYNQVLEVKPSGRSGGDVVWRLDQCNYPYDAVRLDNGNTLIAEYYSNRVVEYDAKNKNVVWQCAINYPISVQRLDNGNTLVCSNYQVVELNREGKQAWQASLSGVRPWRAQRLENGNTLITDYQRGQVVEVDRQSTVVWKQPSLSRPVQAVRLDDGNTLILEQGSNRLIEVDPSSPKKVIELFKGLNYPQGMSTY